jgi:cystathionine beta-synthase
MPVVENGKIVGAVQEITIVHALHRGVDSRTVKVQEVMARPLPEVDINAPLQEIYRLLLAGNPAVVVLKLGLPAGLITRSDLMAFYENTSRRLNKQTSCIK